jgi:hypothetical protein
VNRFRDSYWGVGVDGFRARRRALRSRIEEVDFGARFCL